MRKAVPLLELAALYNANSRILENENPPTVHRAYRKFKKPAKCKNCIEIFQKCTNIEKGVELSDRNEFPEERNNGLEEWSKSGQRNLEHPVGDYDSVDNREIEGVGQVYTVFDENQLENHTNTN